MNLAQYLAALVTALASLEAQVKGLSDMAGMTPEQSAQLAQAVSEVAALRAELRDLASSVAGQFGDVTRTLQAAASAHGQLRSDVDALRSDVDALRAGVGDLSSLPPLPQV
jgi:ubiquinone biosynthesis protein UbiJ